jgi:cytochrome P450
LSIDGWGKSDKVAKRAWRILRLRTTKRESALNIPVTQAFPTSGSAAAERVGEAFDPFDLTDPFPFYRRAREEAPIFYSPKLDSWVFSRYEDIKSIFNDWKTFSSENAQSPFWPLAEETQSILSQGGFEGRSGLSARIPPEHTRLRTIVQHAFGPRRFKAIEPQIRDIINRAIDAFADKGEADLIRDFAYDVPALVIFCLLGIPPEEAPHVKAWSESRALLTWGNLSPEQQIPHAHNMVRYWDYCCALVARRHKEASDDLPGDLVRMQQDGAEISDHEIANICYSQLFAGQETTTSLIGNGLREFLLNPQEWNAVIADRSLIPNAIDEVLRFTPSIVAWRRRVKAPANVGGVDLTEKANLLLLLGSGNRDDAVFEDPERFDVRRKNARAHLSLGYGIHYCLGAQLAKLQMTIVLETLPQRLASLRLKPGQAFTFVPNASFRTPRALLAEWDGITH